jgi:hypothetical protein
MDYASSWFRKWCNQLSRTDQHVAKYLECNLRDALCVPPPGLRKRSGLGFVAEEEVDVGQCVFQHLLEGRDLHKEGGGDVLNSSEQLNQTWWKQARTRRQGECR